ncbi:MAG: threonine--tRNA ligase [Gemmatimonadales bacterium]|jgi:threonyl-tRNA synthetase|nr:threonine--tRNA ligase [Gemmatimonadales bacterium]MDG2240651.1 threonine--tRNA ligase [Longimicrobiales bacterium]MBT3776098.1 threonine--tRNA ligase [Gemmatimonadales bacterium]MBT3958809.1 threonine--tRNA ligase [Gemmatimonadales bacterium]MBT4187760.1 threonine--tRNA ligase [Gemmatimonadales bacterium]
MSSEQIKITLPNGDVLDMEHGSTAGEVAAAIGPGLAKAAVAAVVNGETVGLMEPIEGDATISILTDKSPGSLDVLRHSAAHILATAVRELRPGAGIGFGPSIDDGFYYDFEVDAPFTPEDLEAFEKKMAEVIDADQPFERRQVDKAEARGLFSDDPLKLERLEEFDDDEVITVYENGPFLDLCKGPHLPSTGKLKHFKLLSGAGAYWRGDEKRQMLQRIYGTAFHKKPDLEGHLHMLEESKKRDHRRLGRELDLFQFHPVSPGSAFWTPLGTILYNTLEEFVRERQREDFLEIKTPLLYTKELWEQSGHWGKYRENMFMVLNNESGEHDASLKPMNCPSHHLFYASRTHSYRELPLRFTTLDVLHRNELSGALSGLTRVRQFAQDDCHVYLREDQIAEEVEFLMDFILSHYDTFGLKSSVKFATRPEQRIGSDEQWDSAEAALKEALEATGREYEVEEGDGAFYGPKIDFHVTDSIGRSWQLGTIQLDYNAPERFDLSYVGSDNTAHRPVVIHRAVCGSFERFIAILIEHYAGVFPTWLAPEQVRLMSVGEHWDDSALLLLADLKKAGVRATLQSRETLGYRIREAETLKIPYMGVVGEREAADGTVAVRKRGAGKKQEVMSRGDFIASIVEEIETRALS